MANSFNCWISSNNSRRCFSGDLYPSAGATSVLTTKGDMVDYNTARQRFGIGSTGQVLTVAGALPTWATLTTADSVLTTQGDVLYESASGLARLGFGTSGDVLTTKGTGANPVWETVSAGGATVETAERSQTGSFTTTSTSAVDVTSFTITKPSITDGKCFSFATFASYNDNSGVTNVFYLDDNGSTVATAMTQEDAESGGYANSNTSLVDLSVADGNTLKIQMHVTSGTGIQYGNNTYTVPKLVALGVG